MTAALEARGIELRHGNRRILVSCDLTLDDGQTRALMGRSGAGKSSLLWVLLGLVKPSAGSVLIAGEPMTGVPSRRRAALRARSIGVVFQEPELLLDLSPKENVGLPLLLAGHDRARAESRAATLLDQFGVDGDTPTAALSGGEQQRVSVARAMVNEPAIVIADEPTGSLDEEAADVVIDLLLNQVARSGAALLVVTHDSRVAGRMERVDTLCDGLVIRGGRTPTSAVDAS